MKIGPVRDMDTALKKATGLMLRWPKKPYIYRFAFAKPRKISLTMWFVFYPIDVIFVHEDEIVEVLHNFLPFQTYFPRKKATEVYEFPSGTLKEFGLTVGTIVRYENNELYKKS